MHIERDENGDFVLETPELAQRFGLSSEEFRKSLRQGHITSSVERGEGEDAGTHRLSVRLGNRRWRAILSAQGQVAQEEMTFVRNSPKPRHS
ncbi:hypothetical protein EDE05_11334 [Neorhizobium sp. R1-B]|jgi:hypothetical protein|uniref:DUF6522 family protein n=1 Tax=unclassified Neorhizobium TaxID=2629175 RepID=UPI000DD7CB6B|nr:MULTISPECIES: DUF6522 family protein [unclassified Neorhizobium]TCV66727.1 hypothetical protein EDE09_11534 [Neorhizobium sp. S3-V5DH]TDX78213.1 hypothetical protein EDE05_11334 [Neorhizobium sp. R1-B]